MKTRIVRWSMAAAVLGSCVGPVLAQGVLAPPVPLQDKLSQAASSVGVRRCLSAITRLSTLTLQGSRSHDLLLDWDRKRPDAGPVFSLIGIEYPNAGVAASITAIPVAEGCTVAAERISLAPLNCASVAQQELPGYRMTRLLPVYAVYTDDREPSSSVSLIDSPPGCLVIRRYVEYGWKEPAAPAAPATAPKSRPP